MNSRQRLGKFMYIAENGGHGPCRWIIEDKNGEWLGKIEFNNRWREYEFVPEYGAVFTVECLSALAGFLERVNPGRRTILAASGKGE